MLKAILSPFGVTLLLTDHAALRSSARCALIRLKVKRTTPAVSGLPSLHLIPARSVKVQSMAVTQRPQQTLVERAAHPGLRVAACADLVEPEQRRADDRRRARHVHRCDGRDLCEPVLDSSDQPRVGGLQ